MLCEKFVVERGFGRERLAHVRIEIDGQQAAAVVRTQRNFAAGVCRYGAETEVGVAVRNRLAGYGVPEQHARLGRFPGIMDDFVPKCAGVDFFAAHYGAFVLCIDGIMLAVGNTGFGRVHEFVVDSDRNIGSRHFALGHLGVDESFRIRMFYGYGHHQGTASAVLGHFAG